jgi:hypothetical protein
MGHRPTGFSTVIFYGWPRATAKPGKTWEEGGFEIEFATSPGGIMPELSPPAKQFGKLTLQLCASPGLQNFRLVPTSQIRTTAFARKSVTSDTNRSLLREQTTNHRSISGVTSPRPGLVARSAPNWDQCC